MRRTRSLDFTACLVLLATLGLSPRNAASQASAQQEPVSPNVPTANGGSGDCTADFTVNDSSGKGIYDAKIRIQLKYGAFGLHRIDAVVGTNSEGKARIVGLPLRIRGTAEFTISHGDESKAVPYEPLNDCHSKHDVTLGAK